MKDYIKDNTTKGTQNRLFKELMQEKGYWIIATILLLTFTMWAGLK